MHLSEKVESVAFYVQPRPDRLLGIFQYCPWYRARFISERMNRPRISNHDTSKAINEGHHLHITASEMLPVFRPKVVIEASVLSIIIYQNSLRPNLGKAYVKERLAKLCAQISKSVTSKGKSCSSMRRNVCATVSLRTRFP